MEEFILKMQKRKPYPPTKAEKKHKIDCANSYVETDVPSDKIEMVKNPQYGNSEITIKGDVPLSNASVVHR